jgi:hypothetical protein
MLAWHSIESSKQVIVKLTSISIIDIKHHIIILLLLQKIVKKFIELLKMTKIFNKLSKMIKSGHNLFQFLCCYKHNNYYFWILDNAEGNQRIFISTSQTKVQSNRPLCTSMWKSSYFENFWLSCWRLKNKLHFWILCLMLK